MVSLMDNALEDIDVVPNFELAAIAPDKNLNAHLPKPNLMHKAENKPTHAAGAWEKMVVSDDDAGAALLVLATSVPPITTLSLQDDPPASMDVDDSGEGLTKELEGMTLEVMQDSGNLTRNATLQDCTASLRANIAQLHGENAAATEQLKTLEARITTHDATLLELQGLDQQLWRAEDQLGHQEHTTTILQDAYNAIRQRLTGQPQPPSFPFTNTIYLANPMYGSGQSMVLVNMGQMQAMEGMYLNLPSSVGNISTGSMLGSPSAGPSVSTIAGSSHTGGDTTSVITNWLSQMVSKHKGSTPYILNALVDEGHHLHDDFLKQYSILQSSSTNTRP
ncbi:hypothetical protein EDB19DRAFT_1824764 [Suillus lakei]|nr:hypothetical protein EDB19DRAFT_1824764 [Suillus lakei]